MAVPSSNRSPVQKAGTFQSVGAAQFEEAARLLLESEKAMNAEAHPVAQVVLKEWARVLKAMLAGAAETTCMPFANHVFCRRGSP